jgi:hypothetical protein
MRYVVTFRKRFDFNGEPGQDPPLLLDFADGVIEGTEYVQTLEPPSVHVTEDIGGSPTSQSAEDDGFLAFGSETWIYDVAEGRDDEFKHTIANSELTLEFHEFDDEMIRKPFAS